MSTFSPNACARTLGMPDDVRRAAAFCFFCLAAVLSPALASGQTATETPSQEDPTKAVFFSIRNELFNLADESWTNAFIFRFDRVVLRSHRRLGGKAGVLTRFDVPVVATDRNGVSEAGLGDMYAQALYVPWLSPRFAVAVGSGLSIPRRLKFRRSTRFLLISI